MLLALLLLATAAPSPPTTTTTTAAPLIDVSPGEARTGKLLVVDVVAAPALPALTSIAPTLNGKRGVAFATSADHKQWKVLVPVNIESKLKPQPLVLDAVFADGRRTRWRKPVALEDGGYDHRTITVGKRFISPSKKQRARAAKESKALSAALATTSPERLWRGSFARPTAGGQTSPFGTLRTYNKKRRSRHLGLDLDGDVGAPIVAANRGRVLLATERFYSGGTVLLDHGQGLMTMYFHMSRIDVKPGDLVEKGQGLGAVGASGQVTGPHLHLSVKLDGLYVDPAQLLALDLSDDVDDDQGPPGDTPGVPLPKAPASPSEPRRDQRTPR
jgi:murein DD-endopeptidase MepM/ murein hydrolase activator NlpD